MIADHPCDECWQDDAAEGSDEPRERPEFGCCLPPGECCMPGVHFPDECHTAEAYLAPNSEEEEESEAMAAANARHNEVRSALIGLLELTEQLAYSCRDRVDVRLDERLVHARVVVAAEPR